jgi:hypothetical protein
LPNESRLATRRAARSLALIAVVFAVAACGGQPSNKAGTTAQSGSTTASIQVRRFEFPPLSGTPCANAGQTDAAGRQVFVCFESADFGIGTPTRLDDAAVTCFLSDRGQPLGIVGSLLRDGTHTDANGQPGNWPIGCEHTFSLARASGLKVAPSLAAIDRNEVLDYCHRAVAAAQSGDLYLVSPTTDVGVSASFAQRTYAVFVYALLDPFPTAGGAAAFIEQARSQIGLPRSVEARIAGLARIGGSPNSNTAYNDLGDMLQQLGWNCDGQPLDLTTLPTSLLNEIQPSPSPTSSGVSPAPSPTPAPAPSPPGASAPVEVTDAWLSSDQAGTSRIASFSVKGDTTVWAQLDYRSSTQSHTLQTRWINPAGQLGYTSAPFSLNYDPAHAWSPAVFRVPTQEGTWRVDWYVDGSFVRSVSFTVASTAPSSTVLTPPPATATAPATPQLLGEDGGLQVFACPTTSPFAHAVSLPLSLAPSVPADLRGRVVIYAIDEVAILAPTGWLCTASEGQDGGASITAYPPGEDSSHPSKAINANLVPVCVSCIAWQACGYFPAARKLLLAGDHCTLPPREESHVRITPTAVDFIDPPGVVGSGFASGGNYAAHGVQIFVSGGPTGERAARETCTLPSSERRVCSIIVGDFTHRYSH